MTEDITKLTEEELNHCFEQVRLYGDELRTCYGFTPDEITRECIRRYRK